MDELRDALDAMLAAAPAPEQARRTTVRRPRLHDQGRRHRGHGNPDGRLPRDGRGGGDLPRGRPGPDPFAPDPQAGGGAGLPGDTRGREPGGGRTRRSWDGATCSGGPAPGGPPATFEAVLQPVRGLDAPDHLPRRVQALRRRRGGRREAPGLRRCDGSSPAAGRSCGSASRAPWCWTCSTDSWCGRPGGARRWPAAIVLDVAPPRRPGTDVAERLERRAAAGRAGLPAILAEERGAVLAIEAAQLTGAEPGEPQLGDWMVRPDVEAQALERLDHALREHHERHPLEEGAPLAEVRRAVSAALRSAGAPTDAGLVEAVIAAAAERGDVVRTATVVRLSTHRVTLDARGDELGPLGRRDRRGAGGDAPHGDGARGRGVRPGRDRGGRPGERRDPREPGPDLQPGLRGAREGRDPGNGRGRHHDQRVPRGARDQPEVRRPADGVVRCERGHPTRGRSSRSRGTLRPDRPRR